MTSGIIFLICIVLFIIDRFPAPVVSLAGCCALVLTGASTPQSAFSGFSNDIVFIIFGTEILGIACVECGLAQSIARIIKRISGNKNGKNSSIMIIVVMGIIAAAASAFLNNQVVCTFMMVICISVTREIKNVFVKDITLPVIYLAILGGQCTLIGAPATLAASSLAETEIGSGISMFELLPMGMLLLAVGISYIIVFGFGTGKLIWGKCAVSSFDNMIDDQENIPFDKRKCIIVAFSAIVMITLFITGYVTVGTASMIGALICLLGRTIRFREACAKVDWSIIIWLGCSIGMADSLVSSGIVSRGCSFVAEHIPSDISPLLLLTIFVVITTIISNLIANTTTVIMILPFVVRLTTEMGMDPVPFIIAVTMAAGLSILTPLSCGFIGMTMKLGYRFSDYVRYGAGLQILLTVSIILFTKVIYGV